jgi:hypothetical protein
MLQRWIKKGLIFDGNDRNGLFHYATLPTAFLLNRSTLRILFSARNMQNQSLPFLLDYDMVTEKIISGPIPIKMGLGQLGTFDDSGVMPTCLLHMGDQIWMYYIGWNLGVTVPFRNSIGLAISNDNGLSFERMFCGPILDRTIHEPHFVASNCVVGENNIFKMWYLSCVKWETIGNKVKHFYHIKYATSSDGITWRRDGTVAIDFRHDNEYAISVPRVIREGGLYKMWYSYRGGPASDYYRIGYAESENGVDWCRKDELVDLAVSEGEWDSKMLCYPFIFDYEGNRFMLYNGNDYGRTGFGLAVLDNL